MKFGVIESFGSGSRTGNVIPGFSNQQFGNENEPSPKLESLITAVHARTANTMVPMRIVETGGAPMLMDCTVPYHVIPDPALVTEAYTYPGPITQKQLQRTVSYLGS